MFFGIMSAQIVTPHPVSKETVRDVLEKLFPSDDTENAPVDEYGDFIPTVGMRGDSFLLDLPQAESGERLNYEVGYDIRQENGNISTVLHINSNNIGTAQDTIQDITNTLSGVFGGHVSIKGPDYGDLSSVKGVDERPVPVHRFDAPSGIAEFLGSSAAEFKEREVKRISKEFSDDLTHQMTGAKIFALDNSASDTIRGFVSAMQDEITTTIENSFAAPSVENKHTPSP